MVDLSVVVLSYNVKDMTERCLQSIQSSTKRISYEVIAVDDNSSDGSAQMIRERFPWVRLVANQSNLRYSGSNNAGLRLSQGRYCLLLNCDVIVRPNAFDNMVDFMDAHPDAAAAGCKLLNPDGSVQHCIRTFPNWITLFFQAINWHKLFPGNRITDKYYCTSFDYSRPQVVDCIGTTSFIIRRSTLEQVGFLDERFPLHMADQAYCLKLKQMNRKVYFVPDAEVVHFGSQSINQRSRAEIIMQHRELHTFYDEFFALKHSWWLRRVAHLGISCRMVLKLIENWVSKDKRVIKGPGAPRMLNA